MLEKVDVTKVMAGEKSWRKIAGIKEQRFKQYTYLARHVFPCKNNFFLFYPFFLKLYAEATVQFPFRTFTKIPNVKFVDNDVSYSKLSVPSVLIEVISWHTFSWEMSEMTKEAQKNLRKLALYIASFMIENCRGNYKFPSVCFTYSATKSLKQQ